MCAICKINFINIFFIILCQLWLLKVNILVVLTTRFAFYVKIREHSLSVCSEGDRSGSVEVRVCCVACVVRNVISLRLFRIEVSVSWVMKRPAGVAVSGVNELDVIVVNGGSGGHDRSAGRESSLVAVLSPIAPSFVGSRCALVLICFIMLQLHNVCVSYQLES